MPHSVWSFVNSSCRKRTHFLSAHSFPQSGRIWGHWVMRPDRKDTHTQTHHNTTHKQIQHTNHTSNTHTHTPHTHALASPQCPCPHSLRPDRHGRKVCGRCPGPSGAAVSGPRWPQGSSHSCRGRGGRGSRSAILSLLHTPSSFFISHPGGKGLVSPAADVAELEGRKT